MNIACSERSVLQKMVFRLLIMLLISLPFSFSLTTRNAFPKTPPSKHKFGGWYSGNVRTRLGRRVDTSPSIKDDVSTGDLNGVMNYESSISKQLAEDIKKLSEELGIALFQEQGVPKLGSHITMLQPNLFHRIFLGVKRGSFGKGYVQPLTLNQDSQNINSFFLSPRYTPILRSPVHSSITDILNRLSKNQKLNHKAQRYGLNPDEEIIAKVMNKLTGHARYPEVIPRMKQIISDGNERFPKPFAFVTPRGSRGFSVYACEHFPFLNKPTTRPFHGHIFQDNPNQLLLSLRPFFMENRNPDSFSNIFSQESNSNEGAHDKSENILNRNKVTTFAEPFRLDAGRVDNLQDNDDLNNDLGFGHISEQSSNADTIGWQDISEEPREEAQSDDGLEPLSAAFSMSFGSFAQDDKDCDSILTKPCAADSECQCYGFYHCERSRGRCKANALPASHSREAGTFGGQWHDGPVKTLGRPAGP